MDNSERLGIIDIGSNSIRLVIYEITSSGAYRVIDESKESARLSERLDGNGRISEKDLDYIAGILSRFSALCSVHGTNRIRAVATAAIRNAADSPHIIEALKQRSGLAIDVLSGEEEGRYGFLGMINTIAVDDGLLIDIGGGSTEITLFLGRRLLRSVSFPFGAVNMMKRFGKNGELDEQGAKSIRTIVQDALASEPWIAQHMGLPLVCLGGTVRSLCKIDQRRKKYSLPITHNYRMAGEDLEAVLDSLQKTPLDQRKKIDGLSKDRADIIVPGLHILHTVYKRVNAASCIISGAGLRDGVFFELLRPGKPQFSSVLEHSIGNILSLHPAVSLKHVSQVNRIAHQLFGELRNIHGMEDAASVYLHAASLLYRIGISINYYNFHAHTYYLLAHSRIDGLTHREIVLCALIASYKSEKRSKPYIAQYRDLLEEGDAGLIVRLGSLLQLAAALDRSETQPISMLSVKIKDKELVLTAGARRSWDIERREVASLEKDFNKIWKLKLRVSEN
ncbi:Ppx/GppA phosphatase family protein [Paenibacillus thermotolerans]|uniref:Ppx/GppA phosphatase family protein n=1 Tax=Paenibacillus thermotolerans TaxID=3027807 RepID=UPI0023679BDB|nr:MULTISPECIES: Ppx/GppA phosphatase family protein [unclassified Paenibacillus]